MNLFSNKNIETIILGLVLIVGGIGISIRGKIWDLQLADERYFVGGALLTAGIYALYLVFKSKKRK